MKTIAILSLAFAIGGTSMVLASTPEENATAGGQCNVGNGANADSTAKKGAEGADNTTKTDTGKDKDAY